MFDEQVVRLDPRLADLLSQFVCVRLVKANTLDLSLFQFDYDLTFAAFFLNADRTIYGRFGSRSERENATKEITIEGFRKAMVAALELHRQYPANKEALQAKRQPEWPFSTPDGFPSLHGKYPAQLDYAGNVVRSCMHCHQVQEAQRLFYRSDHKPIPDPILRPWPIPETVGLELDPREKSTVQAVLPNSAAAKAGFQPGDELLRLEGQPLISIADVQWVLHKASAPASIHADILRAGQSLKLTLALDDQWRQRSDISWRVSSWDLRRMALGGMVLKELPIDQRHAAQLPDDKLALLVDYLGEYGEHGVAKKAGFKKGDVIVEADGLTRPLSESDLLGYLLQKRMPGQTVPFSVLRGAERLTLQFQMQ